MSDNVSADETQPKPSLSTSTEPTSGMTLEEWMDAFGAAAIEGFPKVIERDRKALEAHNAQVAREMGLPWPMPPKD
jgi:hypothetical protein